MSPRGFVVAMAAAVNVANYDKPTENVRLMRRWAIVSRFGAENGYLTISIAGAMQHDDAEAPIGLAPIKTAFGILLSENERDSESMFLLVRQLPPGTKIAGLFFPADGYARLRMISGTLHLQAEGRHAHSREILNGHEMRLDACVPAPDAKWAMAWHVDAVRRPWSGDFFPPAWSR